MPVPGVINGGTTLQTPASLPASEEMATIDASGNIATRAIPSGGVEAHASTHAAAGSDPVTLAQSQVTNLTTDLAAKIGGTLGSTANAVGVRGANSTTLAGSSATIDPTTGDLVVNRPGGGSVTISKKSGTNTGARFTVSDNANFEFWNNFANGLTGIIVNSVSVFTGLGVVSNVFTTDGPRMSGNPTIGWRSDTTTNMGGSTTPDTQLGCHAAGVVKALGSGANLGTFYGTFQLRAYTVSTLPSSPADGLQVFATNGRKSGEGSGSGTGVVVFSDGGNWYADMYNSAVVAA